MQVVYYGSYCKVEEPKIAKGKFTKILHYVLLNS